MKKMRMCFPREKTFSDGFQEYILDCKARNLRDGTIHHYQESVKQIYKRIPPNTPISSLNQQTITIFRWCIIAPLSPSRVFALVRFLRFSPALNQQIQLLLNRFALEDEGQQLHHIIVCQ